MQVWSWLPVASLTCRSFAAIVYVILQFYSGFLQYYDICFMQLSYHIHMNDSVFLETFVY